MSAIKNGVDWGYQRRLARLSILVLLLGNQGRLNLAIYTPIEITAANVFSHLIVRKFHDNYVHRNLILSRLRAAPSSRAGDIGEG